jgi:hypothetical protein
LGRRVRLSRLGWSGTELRRYVYQPPFLVSVFGLILDNQYSGNFSFAANPFLTLADPLHQGANPHIS